MIDFKYSGDLSARYISFERPECTNEFKEKMLINNSLRGFLPFFVDEKDGESNYYYDISGMKSLLEYLQEEKADAKLLRRILSDLGDAYSCGKQYLLDENGFILESQAIFYSEADGFRFIYNPGATDEDFREKLSALIYEMMNQVDVNDRNEVYTYYSVYTASKEENATFKGMINMISEKKEELIAPIKEDKEEKPQNKPDLAEIFEDKQLLIKRAGLALVILLLILYFIFT